MKTGLKKTVQLASLCALIIAGPAFSKPLSIEAHDEHDLIVRHIFAKAKTPSECDANYKSCHTHYCRHVYHRHKPSCHALCSKWHRVCKKTVTSQHKKKVIANNRAKTN